MKDIILPLIRAIIYLVGWFTLIWYVNNAVIAENICQTIWGCFAMYMWFNFGKRENTK
jgi:hypothetical protein